MREIKITEQMIIEKIRTKLEYPRSWPFIRTEFYGDEDGNISDEELLSAARLNRRWMSRLVMGMIGDSILKEIKPSKFYVDRVYSRDYDRYFPIDKIKVFLMDGKRIELILNYSRPMKNLEPFSFKIPYYPRRIIHAKNNNYNK